MKLFASCFKFCNFNCQQNKNDNQIKKLYLENDLPLNKITINEFAEIPEITKVTVALWAIKESKYFIEQPISFSLHSSSQLNRKKPSIKAFNYYPETNTTLKP
jgi:hypothetical protein